jgi:hypothetical protein
MGRPRGRIDEVKHAYWLQVLVQWRDSKVSVREFCRQHRHRESQFWFWKRRLAAKLDSAAATTRSPEPAFLPVTVVKASVPASSAIDIRLTSGQRLRVRPGCDRQLLAEVVALLEGKRC